MSTPILVTGATGLLGNNVVRTLLDRGLDVRAFVRKGYDKRSLEGLDLDVAYGDVRDPTDVRTACGGVRGVIHCAGFLQIGWSNNDIHHQVNVQGTQHVLDATRDFGIRMIHVSTVNSLSFGKKPNIASETTPLTGDEIHSNYVLSKRAGEQRIHDCFSRRDDNKERADEPVIVHPGFMLGPWDWKPSSGQMLRELASSKAFLAPRGGCSVCDVRDVAGAIVACHEHDLPSQRYILAGHNVSYLDLWREMASVVGVRPPWTTFGPVVAALVGFAGDSVGRIRGREPVVNSAAVQMSNRFHYYTSALAAKELGYRVRPWQESIRDAWRWISENCTKNAAQYGRELARQR